MNNYPLPLVLLAALLLAGPVLAQSLPRASLSGAASDREDRRCTSGTLSTNPSAPCSDDAVNDRQRVLPAGVRPPAKRMAASRKPIPGTAPQPGARQADKASTGTLESTVGPRMHQQAR